MYGASGFQVSGAEQILSMSAAEPDTKETVETVGTDDASVTDYTGQISDMASLLFLIIFFMGIIAGLLSAKIMWGRVKC